MTKSISGKAYKGVFQPPDKTHIVKAHTAFIDTRTGSSSINDKKITPIK